MNNIYRALPVFKITLQEAELMVCALKHLDKDANASYLCLALDDAQSECGYEDGVHPRLTINDNLQGCTLVEKVNSVVGLSVLHRESTSYKAIRTPYTFRTHLRVMWVKKLLGENGFVDLHAVAKEWERIQWNKV